MHRYGHLWIYLRFTLPNSSFGEIPISFFRSCDGFLRIVTRCLGCVRTLVMASPHVVMQQRGLGEPASCWYPCATGRPTGTAWGQDCLRHRGLCGWKSPSQKSWQREERGAVYVLDIHVCKYFVTVMRINHLLSITPVQNYSTRNTVAVVIQQAESKKELNNLLNCRTIFSYHCRTILYIPR